jgi:EpsI family protein
MWSPIAVRIRPAQWIVVVIVAAVGLAYGPTFYLLHDKWAYSTGTYSHGYLVLVLTASLLVYAARSLRPPYHFSWVGITGVLVTGILWLLAYVSNIMVVQATVVPAAVFAALISIFGLKSAKVWLFPLVYFMFAVPVWDSANWVLQEMTIAAATAFLSVVNITAYIDGSVVQLPNGTFEIAAGCSGLNFFIVALALVSLYGYLYLWNLRNRAWLIVCAALFAVLTNWIRVTTIIIAGYLTDMQHYFVTVDHYMFGWVLFAAMLIPVYLFARRLEQSESHQADSRVSETPLESFPGRVMSRRTLLVMMMVFVAPTAAFAIDRLTTATAAHAFEWPLRFGEWELDRKDVDLGVTFGGSLVSASATYKKDKARVAVYANMYGRQRQGAELISDNNQIYSSDVWKVAHSTTLKITSGDTPMMIQALELKGMYEERRAIYYWYDVAGKSYANGRTTKIAEMFQSLTGSPQSGLRLVAVDCATTCERAHSIAMEFVEENGNNLNRVMSLRAK